MKILYSAGNRIGANDQLKDFILHNIHEIKIAGYIKSTYSFSHIDWTLDAINNDKLLINQLKEDIKKYSPDLVICDAEPIVSNIAFDLSLKLWYCSPLHLIDGIVWEYNKQKYYNSSLKNIKRTLYELPKSEKTYIYSPFGDIKMRPSLKEGYEWIKPYHELVNYNNKAIANILDLKRKDKIKDIVKGIFEFEDEFQDCDKYLCSGETKLISNGLYNNKKLFITPSIDDPETIVNTLLISSLEVGIDLGQIELMNKYSLLNMEEALTKNIPTEYLSIQDRNYLHEEIALCM